MRGEQDMGWWFLKMMLLKGRKSLGLSQQKIADRILRSKDTYAAWERGTTSVQPALVEKVARACGLSEEIAGYMEKVALARKLGTPVEADARFNALILSLAEEYCGFIFKWDGFMIPGPLQLKEYHYTVVRIAEPGSDEWVDNGWDFKTVRFEALKARQDSPTIQFLVGESALLILRNHSEELYRKQIDHLRHCASEYGWEIRILNQPVLSNQGNCSIFMPGNSPMSCPAFVYTAGLDSSWCIDDPDRIEGYDDFRKIKWKTAIRSEDYRYDD